MMSIAHKLFECFHLDSLSYLHLIVWLDIDFKYKNPFISDLEGIPFVLHFPVMLMNCLKLILFLCKDLFLFLSESF